MRPTMNHLSIRALRTDALFVSPLQPSEEPGARQVQRAVAVAVRRFGDRGCAGLVAQEFGEHPELAAARMRWARQAVAEAFGWRGLRRGMSAHHPAARAGHAGRAA